MSSQAVEQHVTSQSLVDFLGWLVDRAQSEIKSAGTGPPRHIHTLNLRLATRNANYARLVDQRLADGPPCAGASQDVSIAVVSADDSPLGKPPVWGEPLFHPRHMERLLEETPFRATWFHDCQLWQVYDYQRRIGVQWMTGDRSYPDWEPGAPLRVFLHWACRFQQMRLAHAGTLGKQGVGVLLAGRGGSGKSGTVVGGIAHGLESAGDDYVMLDPRGESGLMAHCVFRTLKQDPAGLQRLGLAAQIQPPRAVNWQGKYEFTSEEIAGRPLAPHLRIGALLIPRIAGSARSTIRPISRNRAMLALAPTGVFQLPGERDSGVSFFSDIVRGLPCFELELGIDGREVSGTIESFIEGLR